MRALVSAGAFSLIVGATAACAPSASTELSANDAEAIREASKSYTQAAKDTAWATWAGFFTEDAVFLPPNTPAQRGRAAIEAWARTFPPIRDLVIEPIEVMGRADLAYVFGRYSLVTMLPDQPEQPDSGKYIEIWRKQADGSWRLFRDIFNSDIPLAPAAPPASPPKK